MAKTKFTDLDLNDLSALTEAELAEALEDAESLLAEIVETPEADVTPEQVALAEQLDAGVATINARLGEIAAEAQARRDSIDQIRARREQRETEAREAAERAEAEAQAAAEAEKTAAEPEKPETDVTPEVTAEAPAVETVETPQAVAAAALAGRRPAAPEKRWAPPKAALVAAADAGVRPSGSKLESMADVVDIVMHRFKTMSGTQGRLSLGAATIEVPVEEGLTIENGMSEQAMNDVLAFAADPKRLKDRGGLIASGWCAPSETIYDLCEGSTTEGLFDLPTTQVNRGGVRYTEGPDFSALYDDLGAFGWDLTEAQVIAETEKTCVEVPCPTFTDVRLNATGFCVTSGLLTEQGYPELVRSFLNEATIAFEHKKSAKLLAAAVAKAGTKLVATDVSSTASSTLTAIELVAENQREKYRWGMEQVIEVAVPHWVRAAIRADLGLRGGGNDDLIALLNSRIDAYFAARNLNVQWLYNYQPLPADSVTFPATFDALVYKAGTFVAGQAPVISLNTIYDSTLLKVNKAQQLFFEQGLLLLSRCYGAKVVTIPVCSSGRTGIADVSECLVTPAGP